MSDVEPLATNVPEGDASQGAPGPRSSTFRDPVVRIGTYVAIGLVILFLATVVGALVTGVVQPRTGGPRSAAERELLIAAAAAGPGATGEAWAPYVDALVANGDLRKARVALEAARASVVATATAPDLDLSEARLLSAEKRYEQATEAADKAMTGYVAERDARVAAAAGTAATAEQAALVDGYYYAALVRAYAYVELRQWKDAVGMFDVYLAQNPTAADILVDRGNAKAGMNDNAGAEKDFREALRFVPYDEEAKAGLKRIGVAQ